jgi:hypothetical protein
MGEQVAQPALQTGDKRRGGGQLAVQGRQRPLHPTAAGKGGETFGREGAVKGELQRVVGRGAQLPPEPQDCRVRGQPQVSKGEPVALPGKRAEPPLLQDERLLALDNHAQPLHGKRFNAQVQRQGHIRQDHRSGGRVITARSERNPHPDGCGRLDAHPAAKQLPGLPAQGETVDGHRVDTVVVAQFAQLQCTQQGAGDHAHLHPAAAHPGGERTQGLQPRFGPEHKGRGRPGQAYGKQQEEEQPATHQRSAPRVRCTRHELPPSSMALARSSRTWPNGAFQRMPAPAPSFMVKSVKLFMALPAS